MMFTCSGSSNTGLKALVCHLNRKATAPLAKRAELTAFPAAQNKGKLNQPASKPNTSENATVSYGCQRGETDPASKRKAPKQKTNFCRGFFPP